MKRVIFALFALFLITWGVKAYQVHVGLTNPSKVLQLTGYNESETLIGTYVQKGTLGPKWQLVFYNQKTQKVRMISIHEDFGLTPRLTKKTYLNPTPYNYSPLSINLEHLKEWNGKAPALLFHGKWYYKPTFQGIRDFRSIQDGNFTLIGIFYSKDSFWMGVQGIRVCNADFGYPPVGPGGLIVPPTLGDDGTPTVLVAIHDKGNSSETSIVFFDGSTINMAGAVHPECSMVIFGSRLGMMFCNHPREGVLKEIQHSCSFKLKNASKLTQIWHQNMKQESPSMMAMFVARPIDATSKNCDEEVTWVIVTLRKGGYCGDEYSGKLENT
ncbi:hypothetical protein [Thermococcus waiotapuensis]|uniref:Uncharacterized protein n=1 Tax=Thermococcus waiotapuensis TaxID=90909 RepID=A0AAE4T379_9EURY|nr:hypothetical protein [Thermococcus waiotapuensis]MDV3103553.1 hypothetical protein [Thermococcus waiotapuensis]